MTAEELASRITMAELDEWAKLSEVERGEREQQERIARVERQAQANRSKA